jgi:hypothetical protein
MARARNIKPALFKNEVLGVADPIATILFIGLWTLADRRGILEDRPLRIKAEVFPYRDGIDADALLSWLDKHDFIQRYEVDGKACIQINNFEKHQNPHKNEEPSELPDAEGNYSGTQKAAKGMTAECAEAFETFWKLYPRKTAKDNARKAFAKINPDAELLAQILESLAKHCTCQSWLKDDGQFIPHAATWLNGKRWNDEVKPAANVHHFPGASRHIGLSDRDPTAGLTQREDGSYAI